MDLFAPTVNPISCTKSAEEPEIGVRELPKHAIDILPEEFGGNFLEFWGSALPAGLSRAVHENVDPVKLPRDVVDDRSNRAVAAGISGVSAYAPSAR